MRSTYRLTVPQSLYDATCEDCGQPFADSYLFGSVLNGKRLTARTVTGYLKMADSRTLKSILSGLGVTLEKPPLWPGDGSRLSHKDTFG